MNDLNLYVKLSALPGSLKAEVADFIDFLVSKRLKKKARADAHPKAGCMKGTFKMAPDFDGKSENNKQGQDF